MANSIQLNTAQSVAGVGTFAYTVPTGAATTFYTLAVQSTLPPSSALQIVIKQNVTTLITIGGAATNPTPTQPAMGTSARILAAAGDVLSVVLSSANSIDSQPNAVKSTINLFQGE